MYMYMYVPLKQVFVVMKWLMNLISSDVTEPQAFLFTLYKAGGVSDKYVYSLLMRASKLETTAVQGLLACLAPP